jgi:FAD/FMN-containing dehydrogenase
MTGNNSAGSHSIVYGKTIDHVLELSIVLSDASSTVLKALDKAELEAKLNGGALENQIYRQVKRIVEANRRRSSSATPRSSGASAATIWMRS